MKNNYILTTLLLILSTFAFSQAADCVDGDNGCDVVTNGFPISPSGFGNIDELAGNNISNPSTNPNPSPGNAGCLLSGELNSTWITFYVNASGTLEFTLGANGGTGFFDWALWDNTNGNACTDIQNNTLPPVACNWNASSAGFTGMADPTNLPTGAVPGNFEDPLNVVAGQSYTMMFSNWSGLSNITVPLNFIGTAQLGCTGTSSQGTICLGDTAHFDYTNILPSNVTSAVITPPANTLSTFPILSFWPTDTTTYVVDYTSPDSVWTDTVVVNVNLPLTPPTVSADDTTCLGSVFQISGSLGNNTTYSNWTHVYPPGVNGGLFYIPNNTNLTTSVTTALPGLYHMILNEVDSFNICPTVRDTMDLLISEETHSASKIDPSCAGSNDGQITITSTGIIGANQFSIDNGITFSSSNTFTGLIAGTYDLVSRDAAGCEFTSTISLIDPPAVVLTVSPDDTVCQNGTTILTATAINGITFDYHWNQTNDLSSTQSLSPIADSTVSVYATNELGCISNTEDITIFVRDPIVASITENDTVCPGYDSEIIVTATSGYGYMGLNYDWTANGNPMTPTGNSRIVSPSNQTTYCVTVSDNCESTPQTVCTQIHMRDVPIPTLYASSPGECVPATISFYNTTDGSFTQNISEEVTWIVDGKTYIGTNGSNTIDSITHTFNNVGEYDVYLYVESQYGCHSDTIYPLITEAYPIPVADFYVNPNPVSMFEPVVELINLTKGNNTYQWEMPGGNPTTSTEKSPVVEYQQGVPNRYITKLTATSVHGCENSTSRFAEVISNVSIFAPNVFTPDGNNINNTWRVYIEGIDIYDYKLQVFNRWGELVWESRDPEAAWNGTLLSGEIVQDGTYAWVLETKDLTVDRRYEYRGIVNIVK